MKGQSLPLELTIITIGSLILITGSVTVFDAITSTYDKSVKDYHMEKALTDTMTAMYQLNSLDQETARITYETPNRQKQEQNYRIVTNQEQIQIVTNNINKTKTKPEIADKIEGDSDQQETTITKSGNNVMVITGE